MAAKELMRVDTGQDGDDGELVGALKMPALIKRSLISFMTGKLSFLSQTNQLLYQNYHLSLISVISKVLK